MVDILFTILDALFWRIRGGLRVCGKKIPLNKIWFAPLFAGEFCYLTGWDWNTFVISAIAIYTSYQEYGWGEYIGCLLTGTEPTDRTDCPLVDDIVDTLKITINARDIKIGKWTVHIPQVNWKLSDNPKLFGWVGLSLRGFLMTFMIGLAFRNIPFMFCGLGMGTVYWIGGLIDHYIKPDGKFGWCWAEWLFGAYLGLCLTLFA
ncbi:MAG: hypothetical protein J6S67_22390 [Methanobrevibacter sp.]|nr:hypothetical protein [Methanobrevibacter sp.]